MYLIKYSDGKFLDYVHKVFKLMDAEVPLYPSLDIKDNERVSHPLRETLFDVLRVYINLVHDYNQECKSLTTCISHLTRDLYTTCHNLSTTWVFTRDSFSGFASEKAAEKEDLFDIILHCLFEIDESLPVEKRFDVLVLTLTLVINLVENSTVNRKRLMKARIAWIDTFHGNQCLL